MILSFMQVLATRGPSTTREDWDALDVTPAPEGRGLRATMHLALAISVVTFFVSSSLILLDQWIGGQVPAFFMLGTTLVLLGFSVGLFGTILGIGLIVSLFSGATGIVARKTITDSQVDESNPATLRDLVLKDTRTQIPRGIS